MDITRADGTEVDTTGVREGISMVGEVMATPTTTVGDRVGAIGDGNQQ
jgi:hypothetical protein